MRYHDDNKMCLNILKIINSETVQDLSSQTGLSAYKLNRYLELLQKNLLIKNEENAHIYKITEKGTQYLNYYDKIIELLSCKLGKREIVAQSSQTVGLIHNNFMKNF